MKLSLWPGIIILSFSSINIFSQSRLPQPTPTPSRVIVTNNLPAPTRIVQPTPLPIPVVVGRPRVVGDEEDRTPDQDINEKPVRTQIQPAEFRTMSFGQIKNKNDLQFGYGFWRSGQDSILATFSESEQRTRGAFRLLPALRDHRFLERRPSPKLHRGGSWSIRRWSAGCQAD